MTSFSILSESIFIVLLGLASISFISFLSYDLSDPGFNTTGTNDGVNNYIGVFGAYFSSFLFSFFGLVSNFRRTGIIVRGFVWGTFGSPDVSIRQSQTKFGAAG